MIIIEKDLKHIKDDDCDFCYLTKRVVNFDFQLVEDIHLEDEINFDDIFVNSLLCQNLDKTKDYVVFYNEDVSLNNIRVEVLKKDIDYTNESINSCLALFLTKMTKKNYYIKVKNDTNIIFFGTRDFFSNLTIDVEENVKVNINILFINLGSFVLPKVMINKHIGTNSTANVFWNSIATVNRSYDSSMSYFTNSLILSNNNFLETEAELNEKLNLGFSLKSIVNDNQYISCTTEGKNKVSVKTLAIQTQQYILKEYYSFNNSEINTIFRGVFLKEIEVLTTKDRRILVDIFSNMKNTNNITNEDIKIVNQDELNYVQVIPSLVATSEKQLGSHSYAVHNELGDDEILFYLNLFGMDNKDSTTILLANFCLDVYHGDLNSLIKEYERRIRNSFSE